MMTNVKRKFPPELLRGCTNWHPLILFLILLFENLLIIKKKNRWKKRKNVHGKREISTIDQMKNRLLTNNYIAKIFLKMMKLNKNKKFKSIVCMLIFLGVCWIMVILNHEIICYVRNGALGPIREWKLEDCIAVHKLIGTVFVDQDAALSKYIWDFLLPD